MRVKGQPSTHRKILVKAKSKEEFPAGLVKEADGPHQEKEQSQALRGLGSLKGLASSMPSSSSTKVLTNTLSAVGNTASNTAVPEKKGFSFLNNKPSAVASGSRGGLGAGDFIAFSSATDSKIGGSNRGFSFQKSLGSTNSFKNNLDHSGLGTKRPLGSINSVANNTLATGEVNLIELERLKKKMKKEEKRKSFG